MHKIYWLLEGLLGLLFTCIFTVSTLFRIEIVGLTPFQLVLTGTVLEASYFLLEIPTGVIADTISRRLSVLLGIALFGIGSLLETMFPSFAMTMIAQLVWATGYACMSGALEAWIADEAGIERIESVYLRGTQAGFVGSLLGIGLSVMLARRGLAVPMIVGGVALIIMSLVFRGLMRETHFQPTKSDERTTWHAMRSTFATGLQTVRGSRLLIALMLMSSIAGAASEGFDRLWQNHLLDNFAFPAWGNLTTVDWFGIIGAAGTIVSIIAVETIKRIAADRPHVAIQILRIVYALLSASVVLFGVVQQFGLALLCYLTSVMLRRASQPLYSAWLNRSIPSDVRATVISMSGQSDAFGQILGGPIIGLIASNSLRLAIVIAGLALAPVLLLFRKHQTDF